MADYYFKEFEDYVKSLCQQHVDLLHVDGVNVVFIRMQSEEDLRSIPQNVGSSLVIVSDFIGRAVGEFEDNALVQTASLMFVTHIGDVAGNPYAAVQSAMQKSMSILFDFYNRMKQDRYTDDCGPMHNLNAEAMNFIPIEGPVLEAHYGWEMSIPFNARTPAYNPAKWNIP